MSGNKTFKISKGEKARLERKKLAEQKLKKAKQRKILIACISVFIIAAGIVTATLLINRNNNDPIGTYYSDSYSISLKSDGNFSANLPHSVTKSGTYKIEDKMLTFTVDNVKYTGSLDGRNLTIPDEWNDDDGHSHAKVYKK